MNDAANRGDEPKRGSAAVARPPRRARPVEEEELETGEPIPEASGEETGQKKIAAIRGKFAPKAPGETGGPSRPTGQMVLSSAKYLPAEALEEPAPSQGRKKKWDRPEPETSKSFEGQLMNSGVAGGLFAMFIAAAWFILGLMNDFIYFYPPVLFVIGLFALLNGLNNSAKR